MKIIKAVNFNVNSINDLGCNYFQLYKEIKLKKLKYKYYGYDADKNFLELGLKKFLELKKKLECEYRKFQIKKNRLFYCICNTRTLWPSSKNF